MGYVTSSMQNKLYFFFSLDRRNHTWQWDNFNKSGDKPAATGQVVNIKMPVLTDKYLNLSRIINFSADRENEKALVKEAWEKNLLARIKENRVVNKRRIWRKEELW